MASDGKAIIHLLNHYHYIVFPSGGPTEMSNYSRRKVTSVSAKTLPPLLPGVRSIRPFNYTDQSFDLALSKLHIEQPQNTIRLLLESSVGTCVLIWPSLKRFEHFHLKMV